MATYLNDLRLTELATGEGSGTWGTTTNLSLELIGEALGFATQQVFGSDADATTTIADGASDPARAMYFKITSAGSLTATRTCTIAPNTISRVMFIENATTGSQSIAISQGSGASVTILAGKTAVVYLDGAGAGAAVVDAMAGVDPGVTDTLAEVLAAGNTSGANNLIIDNGQAITTNTINETTAASGVTIDSVLLKDDGVNATNLEITNIKANDGTSAGSIADSTGVVTLASSVLTTADINGGTIDGTTLGATTPASVAATTLSTTGIATFNDNVYIPTNTAGMFLGSAGVFEYGVSRNGTTLQIHSGSATPRLTINGTTGAATFSGDVDLTNGIVSVLQSTANSDVFYGRTSSVAASSYIDMYLGVGNSNGGFPDRAAIIRAQNHSSGTDRSELVFLTANSAAPAEALRLDYLKNATFSGTVTATQFSSTNSNASTPSFGVSAGNGMYNAGTNVLGFSTNSLNRMTLDASGNLGLGVVPSAWISVYKSIEFGIGAAVIGRTDDSSLSILTNLYRNSAGDYIYKNTGDLATLMTTESGGFSWNTAASGTAGGTASLSNIMTLDASGDLTTTGAATFGGNVVGLTFESSVSSSSTNLATNSGGSLTLKNTSVTDGNFSNIGGYNSNTLVTSQINFVNVSQASRTGAITFNVHNGASMPEVGRFDASGNFLVGASSTGEAHILQSSGASKLTLSVTNANATTPYGQKINFSAAAPNDATYYFLTCADTSATRATIRSNGGLANYSANDANLSDEREKNQFGLLGSTTACLREWEIVKYLYKDEDQTLDPKYGVIAQQVAPHCPEVITDWVKVKGVDEVLWTDEDELPEGVAVGDVKTAAVQQVDRIGVKEQQMFWMLVKSHQEALDTIDALTARLDAAGL
jgi:hypothetical protein